MNRNCVLPSRHWLLVCNDPSLSKYDEIHLKTHREISKSNKNSSYGLDKVEILLDKQFEAFVSSSALTSSDFIHETKLEIIKEEKNNVLKDNANVQIKSDVVLKEVENALDNEISPSSVETVKRCESPLKSTKTDDEFVSLGIDKCILTEKDINTVTENIFDPSIYRDSLIQFYNFLKNVHLFNKAKIKLNECKNCDKGFIKLSANNLNLQSISSSSNAIKRSYLGRNSDQVFLRKRKGCKRKIIED